MRDPERINPFCEELIQLWRQVPDWRFAQFVSNLMIAYRNKYGYDAFYCEDENFITFAQDWIKELSA